MRERAIFLHGKRIRIVYLDGVDTKIMTKLRKFIMENPPKILLHKTRLLLTYCCRQDNLVENAGLSRNYDKIYFFLANYILRRCSYKLDVMCARCSCECLKHGTYIRW